MTATVITATRATTKMTTRIGERRGGRERDLRINGMVWQYYKLRVIMVGRFLAPTRSNGCVTSTVISQVTSKKKRISQNHLSWDTKCPKNVRPCGQFPPKKMVKTTNQHAYIIPHCISVSQLCRYAGCVRADLLFFSIFFWRERSTRMSTFLTFCVPAKMLTCVCFFLM